MKQTKQEILGKRELHNVLYEWSTHLDSPSYRVHLRGCALNTKYEKRVNNLLAQLCALHKETDALRDEIYRDAIAKVSS